MFGVVGACVGGWGFAWGTSVATPSISSTPPLSTATVLLLLLVGGGRLPAEVDGRCGVQRRLGLVERDGRYGLGRGSVRLQGEVHVVRRRHGGVKVRLQVKVRYSRPDYGW